MSIRPVDLQSMVHRSVEVGKSEHLNNNRSDIEHRQFANQLQKDIEVAQHQVTQMDKTEKGGINKDGKGNNQAKDMRKKKKDRHGEVIVEDNEDTDGSMFDFRV